MHLVDLFEETFFAISANKARSILTVLGIVIGIGSVVAMISVGQGAAKNIEANIQSLGSNMLMVTPGSQRGVGTMVRGGFGSAATLTLADAQAIGQEVGYVQGVASEVSSRKQVTVKGANTNTSIYGVTSNYLQVKNIEMDSGSFLTAQQVSKSSKVAVLGPTTRDDLFGEGADALSQKIRIGSQEFTVIGITKTKGGTGMGNTDDRIYIPLSTAQHYLTGNDSVSTINVQITEEKYMSAAEEELNALLLVRHKISDETQADFTIMNQADIISAVASVAGTMTLLLGAIASISLLVGGIGIMNMMLTTVTERTREIGLRKSLGARKKDISLQFLAESATLTFIGGIIGVFLGWVASLAIAKLGSTNTSVTISSVLLAFGVSAAIGIVFGYYPARRAARLNPIEALRYE